MDKTYRIMSTYIKLSIPFVIIVAIWSYFNTSGYLPENSNLIVKILWELLSWNIMIWFTTLVIFLIMTVFSKTFQEKTFTKISCIRNRDEREEQITGKAASKSYTSTFAVLILLIFLSTLQVSVKPLPQEEMAEGRTRYLSIGLSLSAIDNNKIAISDDSFIWD